MSVRWTAFAQRAFCLLFILLVFVIPFSIAAISISVCLLLAAWGVGGRKAPAATLSAEWNTLWALFFYAALCGLSIARTKFPVISWTGFIGKTLKYSLLFLLASHAVKYARVPSWAVRAVLASTSLVVLYSLWQEWAIFHAPYQATAKDPIRGFVLGYVRMVGPYKNPNDLATYLMVTSLLVISLLIEGGRPLSLARGTLAFLSVGCMIWTSARGAVLGFLAGALLLATAHMRRKGIRLTLLAIMAASVSFLLFLSRSHWKELLTLSDIASHDRLQMWGTGWAMFRDRPIFGQGINTFMANYGTYSLQPRWPAYAHNCYLQIAAETGIVGLAFFLYFLFCLGSVCRRALRTAETGQSQELRPVLLGLAAGVLAFLVQSAFDTNLYALRQAVLFWTFSGMILGISGLLLQTGQSSQPRL